MLEVFSFLNVLLTGSEDLKERLLSKGELDNDKIVSHCKSFKDKAISIEIEFNEEVNGELYRYSYFIEVVVGSHDFDTGYVNKEIFKYKKISSTGSMSTAFERKNTIVRRVKGPKIQKIYGWEALVSRISKIWDIKESFDKPIQIRIDNIFLVINIAQDLKGLVFKFNDEQENDINELSDGTLIVLNIVTYLVSNKYSIIAIEELENSIHPKLLKKMINLIKNDFYNIQVIITTHLPVLLNMVKVDEVSIISNRECGQATIEQVKNKKELIKKLSGSFSF